ncbi:hypothetical protein HB370_12280 [Streptomyces sp. DSM 40868]|nr:hypothetical protein HB370_12280 [Streptomyces sp. DSM 40868]
MLLKENLAGKEHLAALTAVGLLCLLAALRDRDPDRLRPHRNPAGWTGRGPGTPPVRT